ncbi:MAG: SDR family NAD(P)-dependent oxidoreductase [Alphaproteobacteria bacterium]|nr:SDR family NAD(P)-dependent oxidoreductase [Alphaproteobacteria bacterium]
MADLSAFAGKLALVTGAGDGIGAMLAKGFASAGMRVAVQDIRAEAAERVAGEIGAGAFPVVFDVSDRAAAVAAAEGLRAKGEAINLLWINAGVGVGSPIGSGSQRTIEWAYSVNVLGLIWTTQAFGPLVTEASGARHVGVTASTIALRAPEPPFPLYGVTKHAALALAEALRGEFAAVGVGTTILCPGLISTNIWDGARARPERFGGARSQDPSIAGRWREATKPEAMWPHVARVVSEGGGYLVCATDGDETAIALEARTAAIKAGIVQI